ncbi:hypothetical protein ACFVZ3_06335 [Kitasatospora purpeofusca]|uniref:hypothetical protein n=1 Tax=Kitasatospora purpeofusca TaxID=67352 RepID=UPI0036D1818A
MEVLLDRTQVLVMGQDDFVREVENADGAIGKLGSDADGEVVVAALVADGSGRSPVN